MISSASRQTYEGLNALRGIAAIAVVFFHARGVLGVHLASSGELAVDFFFMLSGFVIAHAYDGKLTREMSLLNFLIVRLRRLYPVYLVSLFIGLAVIAGLFTLGAPIFPLWQPLVALILALAFLPLPPSPYSSELLYPLNPPAWSLSVEMAVNVAYAAFHRMMTTPVLLTIAGAAFFALLIATLSGQPATGGVDWSTFGYGYLRALYSFPVGVLLYRYRKRLPRGFLLPSAGALALLLCVDPGKYGPAYKFGFIVLGSPALLIGGLGPVNRRWAGLCKYLGRTSYPIYALHFPAIMLADSAAIYLRVERPVAFFVLLLILLIASPIIDEADEKWRKARLGAQHLKNNRER